MSFRKLTNLSKSEKAKAAEMWKSGDYTAKEIGEKFQVNYRKLYAMFNRMGIERGENRKHLDTALTQALKTQAASQAEELTKLAVEHKEMHLKSVEFINKRILALYRDNHAANKPITEIKEDLETYKIWSDIISKNYGTASKVLHLDKPNEDDEGLHAFEIVALTDRDVEDMRDQQAIEDAAIYGSLEDMEELEDEDIESEGEEGEDGEQESEELDE